MAGLKKYENSRDLRMRRHCSGLTFSVEVGGEGNDRWEYAEIKVENHDNAAVTVDFAIHDPHHGYTLKSVIDPHENELGVLTVTAERAAEIRQLCVGFHWLAEELENAIKMLDNADYPLSDVEDGTSN